MTSERGARAALLGAALLASCGQSVHDLGAQSGPLVTLHAHVDLAALPAPPSAPLLGVLVWAAVPAVNPVCLLYPGDARIAAACPDPFGVYLGATETWTTVGPDGDFDLPLAHLPDAGVTVGDASARIAYGTLLVMEDLDQDGTPTFVPSPFEDEEGNLSFSSSHPDRVDAASFYHLRAPQQRVVYREGGWVAGSYFYSAPGCAAPPDGFSILTAAPYVDATQSAGPCSYAPIETRVEIPVLAPGDPLADPTALLCRSAQNDGTVRRAAGRRRAPSAGYVPVCFDANLVATVYSPGVCQVLRSYALAGCALNPSCPTPEWDDTASPPSWWPCP